MRVTKNIRSFIETEVEKALMADYLKFKKEEDAVRKEIEDFFKDRIRAINTEAEEKFHDYYMDNNPKISEGYHATLSSPWGRSLKVTEKAMMERRAYQEKAEREVSNIILNLELGANKEELMAMLAKVGKEEG